MTDVSDKSKPFCIWDIDDTYRATPTYIYKELRDNGYINDSNIELFKKGLFLCLIGNLTEITDRT